MKAIAQITISFVAFFYLSSYLTPVSADTTGNNSGITGFAQNNTIRNLANPVLKMEKNPLTNLSDPLANLSNPLANLSNPLEDLSNPLQNLTH